MFFIKWKVKMAGYWPILWTQMISWLKINKNAWPISGYLRSVKDVLHGKKVIFLLGPKQEIGFHRQPTRMQVLFISPSQQHKMTLVINQFIFSKIIILSDSLQTALRATVVPLTLSTPSLVSRN